MKKGRLLLILSCCIALPLNAINYPQIPQQKGLYMTVRKVIIPAAGYGTRFLPITKSIPKEMLPLLNQPALQAIIQESIDSEINHFCIVMNDNKPEIKDYFSSNFAFRSRMQKSGKGDLIADLESLLTHAQFTYIKQPEMLGLGHAIMMAQSEIGKELFGVILPDMVVFNDEPCMKPLVQAAQEHEAIVIAVMEVPMEEISSYGCIKIGKKYSDNLMEITDIIEKPKPDQAFSNLAILGRYIFTPAIFDAIEATAPHASGEIQLTDAIALLARQGHKVLAYKVTGHIFDLGRPQGWLAANIFLGLKSPEFGAQIRELITGML